MLREIFIKNFAIIDELRIDFSEGLTILSGETGAGKSIIISALNILLGGRADSGLIRTGADTAELEALFDIEPGSHAARLLEDQGHDEISQLLIRRILSVGNRHRVYINGRMTTMQVLGEITENIAGISGQHEHLKLLKEAEHLKILDRFGGLEDLRELLNACHSSILPGIRKLDDLHTARSSRIEEIEMLEFQKEEIEKAALEPDEDEILNQKLLRLKNAQTLYENVGSSVEALYNREGAISGQLAAVKKEIAKAAEIDPELTDATQSLEESLFRIEDVALQLRSYLDTISFDPARAEEIEARLHLINRLKRKYGPTLNDIFGKIDRIRQQLSETMNVSEKISLAEADLVILHEQLVDLDRRLAEKRFQAAEVLSRKMEEELLSLNMPDTKFEVVFRGNEARPDTPAYLQDNGYIIYEYGSLQPYFMISPNVGETLKPLSKIASGGELSRVILALKAILVDTDSVGTVIFDEVDAGIGGKTATVVGKKLAGIATSSQVICITHLAQIAKFGDRHLKIEKYVENGRTATRVINLMDSERIEETARMIGGQAITTASRAHAKELLECTSKKE